MVKVTYFVQAGDGPIKIGSSVNPVHRTISLQNGCPKPVRLLGTTPRYRELQLHKKFSELRIRGEWFKLDNELARWVCDNTSIKEHEKLRLLRLAKKLVNAPSKKPVRSHKAQHNKTRKLYTRVNGQDVMLMRRLKREGLSYSQLSKESEISKSTVGLQLKGYKEWPKTQKL